MLKFFIVKVRQGMNWINSIKKYRPCNEQEKNDKEIIIRCFRYV